MLVPRDLSAPPAGNPSERLPAPLQVASLPADPARMIHRALVAFLLPLTLAASPALAGKREQLLPEGVIAEFAQGNPVDLAWYDPPTEQPTFRRDESVLVLDASAGTISRFSPEGELEHRFGGSGLGPGELMNPQGLAVDRAGRWLPAD